MVRIDVRCRAGWIFFRCVSPQAASRQAIASIKCPTRSEAGLTLISMS